MRKGARGIQSVEVSGRILLALVEACRPMMLKELAQAAELAPAQCHAYLTSLRNVGLVHQDAVSGLYRTGPFAMRLGIGWLRGAPLAAVTIKELRAVTEETGAMSLIAVWGAAGATVVHQNAGVSQTALNIRQGTIFSVTGTATGRIFAAYGSEPDLEEKITTDLDVSQLRGTIGTILTREAFEQELDVTRAHGYSTVSGVPIPGINAVSAPVFDTDGKLGLVATLIGPSAVLPVDKDAPGVTRLLEATRAVSHKQHGAARPTSAA